MFESIWDKLNRYTRLDRLSYPVPEHGRHLPYVLGGLTFFGFLILIASGLLIAQFYNPASPNAAYESVQALQKSGVGYFRSLHVWVANATVLILVVHLLRVFFSGAYKFPRQVTWWIGIALFATMVFGSYFSGTVLKWDAEAAEAAEHYKVSLRLLGPIGEFLIDEHDGNSPFSVRMYVSHIALFPLIIVVLVVAHFYLIRMFSLAPTPRGPYAKAAEIPREEMRGKFYHHGLSILLYGSLYFGLVSILALLLPAELGGIPTGGHAGAKPPWIFLWVYGLENYLGVNAIFYGNILLFLLLFLVPFLDRGSDRTPSKRRKTIWIGGLAFFTVFLLTAYAWIAPRQVHQGMNGPARAEEEASHSHEEGEGELPHAHDNEEPPPSDNGEASNH